MLQRALRSLVRVNGYTQEYLCLDPTLMEGRFQWSIEGEPIDPRRILFLGYRPLVLAIPDRYVRHRLALALEGMTVAGMRLHDLSKVKWTGHRCLCASDPHQRFLPPLFDPLDRLRQWSNSRRSGNVSKSMIEYDLLRIAYTQPREIHLGVVGPPDRCNIFPTDLHGPLGREEYIISLRHTGNACRQVQETGSLLLCRMSLDQYRRVYGLAARHMSGVERAERIVPVAGQAFGHALPEGTLNARWLELVGHDDMGIHRLLRFRIKAEEHYGAGPVLAHAHAAPLGLLKRRGQAVPVLLR